MKTLIRAIIVDDSAFVRKMVKEMLCRSPMIDVVGAARDGAEALKLVEELNPDVVTCDLMMPGMDGVTFVREQMKRQPVPILILTATPEDGEKAMEAMDAGAVDIVQKPSALATHEILNIQGELIEKVKAAGQAPVARLHPIAPAEPITAVERKGDSRVRIVVIGISTGGPQALRYLLPQLPAKFPVPIAIVLHMPVGYTEMFAQKLNELSPLRVVEAREGLTLEPGTAVLAAAGRHLVLRREGDRVVAGLSPTPLTPHRPSADVLFESAARCYGSGVLGVVMTGMGDDGKEGASWIKAQGGTVLTQAEESCIIYGMPRSVVEAGLSDGSAPLETMAQTIIENL